MTNLIHLRIAYGLTQAKLEAMSGVSRWKIGLAETGRFKLEEGDLKKIGEALSFPANELLKNTICESIQKKKKAIRTNGD